MKRSHIFYLLLLFVLVWSCTKDFIVKNIKNATITIDAPANNLTTSYNSITFWWEALDGAEKYNLQIVTPSFAAVQQLIVDTNVTGTKFTKTLTPGTYQWRIKGVNAGGSTVYTTYTLKIDTTTNLASVLVSDIAPVNNYLTGSKTIAFSWSSLASATSYEIKVLNSSSVAIIDTTTANTNYTRSFASGGVYTWMVKALNAFSFSQYNSPLTFTIDVTPPSASVLSSPSHGSSVKDTTSLKWTRTSTDTWTDSLYVSIDSSFISIVSTAKVYTNKIKISALSPTLPVSVTYYWWRVKSIDSVGNKSAFSNQLKFKLIP